MEQIATLRNEVYLVASVAGFFLVIIGWLLRDLYHEHKKVEQDLSNQIHTLQAEITLVANTNLSQVASVNQRIDSSQLAITREISNLKEELLKAIFEVKIEQGKQGVLIQGLIDEEHNAGIS